MKNLDNKTKILICFVSSLLAYFTYAIIGSFQNSTNILSKLYINGIVFLVVGSLLELRPLLIWYLLTVSFSFGGILFLAKGSKIFILPSIKSAAVFSLVGILLSYFVYFLFVSLVILFYPM